MLFRCIFSRKAEKHNNIISEIILLSHISPASYVVGGKLRHSGTQTDTITRLHLQPASHYPFFFTISSPCSCSHRHPRSSLGGYFHSRKCRVTRGSISSQQSGLKLYASPDAYFIFLHALYSSRYILLAALFSIFVHLQSLSYTH